MLYFQLVCIIKFKLNNTNDSYDSEVYKICEMSSNKEVSIWNLFNCLIMCTLRTNTYQQSKNIITLLIHVLWMDYNKLHFHNYPLLNVNTKIVNSIKENQ